MDINFDNGIIKALGINNEDIEQKKCGKPLYSKNLKNDVFEKSKKDTPFLGTKSYINSHNMQYSQAELKDARHYIKDKASETDKIQNNTARWFAQRLHPLAAEKMQNDFLKDGTSIYDAMIAKGDKLKKIEPKTYEYVNQRIQTGLCELSGKELALVMLEKDEKTSGAQIINALNELKANVSEENYNEFLEGYILNPKTTPIVEKIKEDLKPLDKVLEDKIKNIQHLLDKNPDQKTIAQNKEKFRLASSNKHASGFSDLELGCYLTLKKDCFGNPKPTDFTKRLEKIEPRILDVVYDEMLTKCTTGEIDSNEMYDTLFSIRPRSLPFRNFTFDDWTNYIIDKIKELEAKK